MTYCMGGTPMPRGTGVPPVVNTFEYFIAQYTSVFSLCSVGK